ncbi:MAG: ABC transporter ATP-binding protein [Candidatus Saccharimonadales bacterium]
MINREKLQSLLEAFDNDKAAAIRAIQDYKIKNTSLKALPAINTNDVVISLRSVSKIYNLKGDKVHVLNDVSLDIYEAEFVAITGSSGSGKSTLLQLMGGLDKPTTGVIEINEQDISKLSDGKLSQMRNSTIGFVFQFFYLQPFLKLDKNIEVPGMFGGTPHSERDGRVEELLNIVGLDNKGNHYPKQLSGGQLQRAAISRALLNKPKIILADEPTGNLDSKNSEAIIEIFENMRKLYNVTIVLVTHDNEIAQRADRVLTMKDGVVL